MQRINHSNNKSNMNVALKICTAVLLIIIYGCKNNPTQIAASSGNVENSIKPDRSKKAATLKNLKSADAAALIKEFPANTVVLDVRTAEEIANGKIDNAIEIDYRGKDFKDKVSELDKSKIYLVHCKSGGRSSKAVDMMKSLGFTQCYNVEEGYETFKKTLDSN